VDAVRPETIGVRSTPARRGKCSAGPGGPGVSLLDLCCGVAGPGRMATTESGCRYLGVDHCASALARAQELAGNLPCRFDQAHLPPLPEGRFEVVLLLERSSAN
jgi:ubiquinone/menaquinone biosynthesis C-methylase UbiE